MWIISELSIAISFIFPVPACEEPQWLSRFKTDLKGKGLHQQNTDAANQQENVQSQTAAWQCARQKGQCRAHLLCWMYTSSLAAAQSALYVYSSLNDLSYDSKHCFCPCSQFLLWCLSLPFALFCLLFSSPSFLLPFKLLLSAIKW